MCLTEAFCVTLSRSMTNVRFLANWISAKIYSLALSDTLRFRHFYLKMQGGSFKIGFTVDGKSRKQWENRCKTIDLCIIPRKQYH